jgi:hypothetical protein
MAKLLWTQKQDIGPRSRVGHAMTYDAGRQRVVLFGGDSLGGTLFGDTWEWDGENWTQVQDIGPSARAFHAIAHDSSRNRIVLFGGRTASGLERRGNGMARTGRRLPTRALRIAGDMQWLSTAIVSGSCCSAASSANV